MNMMKYAASHSKLFHIEILYLRRQNHNSHNARNSAHFREIIGDIVRISIEKGQAKKAIFWPFLLRKTELLWFLSVKSV